MNGGVSTSVFARRRNVGLGNKNTTDNAPSTILVRNETSPFDNHIDAMSARASQAYRMNRAGKARSSNGRWELTGLEVRNVTIAGHLGPSDARHTVPSVMT